MSSDRFTRGLEIEKAIARIEDRTKETDDADVDLVIAGYLQLVGRPKPERPDRSEEGVETHPSYITIRANRVSCSPPGMSLFDSEILHRHFVRVTVQRCERHRDLGRDWVFNKEMLLEIDMSMAQWGGFVSSFGDGSGVPVTMSFLTGEGSIPSPTYEPRMAVSVAEVRSSATEALERIQAAATALTEAHARKAGRREIGELTATLQRVVDQAPGNMVFAAKSLTEHVENVVAKARYDIAAQVDDRARQLGVEANADDILAITAGPNPEGDPS